MLSVWVAILSIRGRDALFMRETPEGRVTVRSAANSPPSVVVKSMLSPKPC